MRFRLVINVKEANAAMLACPLLSTECQRGRYSYQALFFYRGEAVVAEECHRAVEDEHTRLCVYDFCDV